MAASPSDYIALKAREWRRRLLYCVAGLVVFETLTGLSIWLLPFSVPNQLMVVFHTVAGIAFVAPYLWYQIRHWRIYRAIRVSNVVLTGYFAMVASVVLIVSGLVLAVQAIAGTRIIHGWDLTHIVATFGLVGSVVPHVVTLLLRATRAGGSAIGVALRPAMRRFGSATLVLGVAFFVPVALTTAFYRPPKLNNDLPKDYSYVFGPNRPFAPSLARTASGGAYDARSLSGSKSCGTAA